MDMRIAIYALEPWAGLEHGHGKRQHSQSFTKAVEAKAISKAASWNQQSWHVVQTSKHQAGHGHHCRFL